MELPNDLQEEAVFATFDTLRVDDPEIGAELIDIFTKEIRERVSRNPGFVSARAHSSLDGTIVVNLVRWLNKPAYQRFTQANTKTNGDLSYGVPGRPGVSAVAAFGGTRDARIEGPAVARPPGIVSVATRHLAGHEAAREVTALLLRSGEWKMHSPGFISATSYISHDGMTYINYPQWVDEESFNSYMADSRNAPGQKDIAPFEVAPVEFVMCRVVSDIESTSPAARN